MECIATERPKLPSSASACPESMPIKQKHEETLQDLRTLERIATGEPSQPAQVTRTNGLLDPAMLIEKTTTKTSLVPHLCVRNQHGPKHDSTTTAWRRRARANSINANEMFQKRLAIRKQLRFLFIYPLIYVFLWIFPFIRYCFRYAKDSESRTPFWLVLLNIITLCTQAGVDAIIFCLRERPWRSSLRQDTHHWSEARSGTTIPRILHPAEGIDHAFAPAVASTIPSDGYIERSWWDRDEESLGDDNDNTFRESTGP